MKYRKLGNSDLNLSVVGLGGNTFGAPRLDCKTSVACIDRAAELGVNFIDTALIYGGGQSEEYIGKAIKGRRSDWVIATKFHLGGMGEGETVVDRIRAQCEESLKNLGSDYIDLYQIHMPSRTVGAEEILSALSALVHEGKVRWMGECNYASWRHAEALKIGKEHNWPSLVSAQNHYNLLRRDVEFETLPFCDEHNIGFLPYHPLAGGFLTDKYVKGEAAPAGTRGAAGSPIIKRNRTAHKEDIQQSLKTWAHARDRTLGDLAVAWLLACPQVTSIIAGVSSPEHVEQNVRSSGWVLTADEKLEVDEIASWDGSEEKAEITI